MEMRRVLSQLSKFTTVTLIGTGLHMVALVLITELLGIFYVISYYLARILSGAFNFLMNRHWTFRSNGAHLSNIGKQYSKFFVVNVTADIVGGGLLYALTDFVGIYYVYSQVIVIVVMWVFLFATSRKYIFRL